MEDFGVRSYGLMLVAILGLSACADHKRPDTRADLLRPVKGDHSGANDFSALSKSGKVHGSMSMSSGFGTGSGVGNGLRNSSPGSPAGGW
ncbi:hypothetical protein FXF46_14540 [Gluconobacter thailandicus]|uniref:Lipoprotein n=1 Tax=Gluconobacter thailandicus TaxID=257438 RepID=A0AAP9EUZ8_GLUTH|nr:hypothetical protein FXF46_14540 [Gluconobacter thailandicus]